MSARRWVRATMVLSVGLVGLVGCASAPDPVTAAAAMPLDPYLRPADAPAPPSTPEEAAAARSVVENAVAACMAERGFRYVPYVPPGTGAEYAPASREWSARWGYGVVAQFEAPTADPDPNRTTRDSLSTGEQAAWDAALDGTLQTVLAAPPEPLPSAAAEPDAWPEPSAATLAATGLAPSSPEPAEVAPETPVASAEEGSFILFDDRHAAESAASEAAAAQVSAAGEVPRVDDSRVAVAVPVPVPASTTRAEPIEASAWATAAVVAGPDGASSILEPIQAVPAPVDPVTTRTADGCRAQAENSGDVWTAYTPLDSGADPWASRVLLSQQINDDPGVAAATAAWTQCLADAGHPGMTAASDPVTSIVTELTAQTGTAAGSAPGATELDAVRAREIALAVADHDCRVTSGLTAARDAAQRAMEQEYVDSHRVELEQLRDAISGGG